MEIPDIKPNSNKFKREQRETEQNRERMQKVVSSAVKTKKQSELGKFAKSFITDDAGKVGNYIRDDVVIPAVKDTILDIIIKGATMIFGGSGRAGRGASTLPKISYGDYYDRFKPYNNPRAVAEQSVPKNRFDYDNLIFANRADAELVLDQMLGAVKRYGIVTVLDLYDSADVTAPFTSDKYGWTDLSSASVERTMGGYIIKLPRPMPID